MIMFRRLISMILVTSVLSSHLAYAQTPPGSPRAGHVKSSEESPPPASRQMVPVLQAHDPDDGTYGGWDEEPPGPDSGDFIVYGSLNATGSPLPGSGGALVDVEATGHRITPALVKRAYKGDESARALVEAWVRRHRLPDLKQAHDKVWVLKHGGGGAARLIGDDYELYDTVSPHRSSEHAPLLQGSLEPYDLTTLQAQPFPDGYEDPELRNKMLGMLTHLHRYTIKDEITWKQWGAIVAAVALGGWAITPELPVFIIGFADIFFYRLGDKNFFASTTNVLLLESYVGITAGIDNLARLSVIAKTAFSPSAAQFMIYQQRKWPVLIVCGFITGLFQLFYFVDAETTFLRNAENAGVDTKPYYNTLYALIIIHCMHLHFHIS